MFLIRGGLATNTPLSILPHPPTLPPPQPLPAAPSQAPPHPPSQLLPHIFQNYAVVELLSELGMKLTKMNKKKQTQKIDWFIGAPVVLRRDTVFDFCCSAVLFLSTMG